MNEEPPVADGRSEQRIGRMVAGALAHLATHMTTGCPRSATLAAILLERIANDPDADDHLRSHARELAEILGGDWSAPGAAASRERANQSATRAGAREAGDVRPAAAGDRRTRDQ